MLKKAFISPGSIYKAIREDGELSATNIRSIENLVNSMGYDWLIKIFNWCLYVKNLRRLDACIFDTSSPGYDLDDIFLSNIHALRYFLGVDIRSISFATYMSMKAIERIEYGDRKKVSKEEIEDIRIALRNFAIMLGDDALEIFDLSHHYKILNQIPKSAHCGFRKKYTPYNEVNSDNILKGE